MIHNLSGKLSIYLTQPMSGRSAWCLCFIILERERFIVGGKCIIEVTAAKSLKD